MQTVTQRLADSLSETTLDKPRPFADLGLSQNVREALRNEFREIQLKPAAVLIGIHKGRDNNAIVLTRRSETMRNHPGQISFPGGKMDAGDKSLHDTALRESYEEINLPTDMVNVIGYLPDYPTVTGFRVTPVVGLIDSNASEFMKPDGIEATELIHLPIEFALDKASYERKLLERNGISVPVYHLTHGEFDIWGATAGMLYQLCLHYSRYDISS